MVSVDLTVWIQFEHIFMPGHFTSFLRSGYDNNVYSQSDIFLINSTCSKNVNKIIIVLVMFTRVNGSSTI